MSKLQTINVSLGDGIGPEITSAVLKIFEAAQVPLSYQMIELGEKAYLSGHLTGVPPEAWGKLQEFPVLLKGPLTTPLGSGFKSVNVTLRKSFGLFSNIRPVRTFAPALETNFPKMDLVIIRENEEDLYAGIEHQQTPEVVQCLKIMTREGCEKIIRYAFEYTRLTGRKKITCMTKNNIMKITDGMFEKVFQSVSKEYPQIEKEHMIIDIGTALVAAQPEKFDVIVTSNLYGDILSDVAAQVAGSVGFCGSANLGEKFSMFEAVHGSAPLIAGKNIANPSGLLTAGIMMLNHLGLGPFAEKIENAWLKTLEDQILTGDLARKGVAATTTQFTEAIIARMGQKPRELQATKVTQGESKISIQAGPAKAVNRELVGVDVFIYSDTKNTEELGSHLSKVGKKAELDLKMVSSRGIKVWPKTLEATTTTDHWRCRFMSSQSRKIQKQQILSLLTQLDQNQLDVIKTENLYDFDGAPGFSAGQGE